MRLSLKTSPGELQRARAEPRMQPHAPLQLLSLTYQPRALPGSESINPWSA